MPRESLIRALADANIENTIALWTECGLTEPWNDPHADIEWPALPEPPMILIAVDLRGRIVTSAMAGSDGHRSWLYY
jgi:hypothetical protein